ncbi:MAG: hypothetical protein MJ065_05255 [Oscillospiraceae bacterium]|nr:hypothetical protein [Oscillospiraceae bacterium]
MMRLRHEAGRRLRPYRRSTSAIGAARYVTGAVCLLTGILTQKILRDGGVLPDSGLTGAFSLADLYLPAALLIAMLALTPLKMQSDWQLGRLAGTLDENDLGFLACSGSVWLWCRALAGRLLLMMLLLIAAVPALLLYAAAKTVWLTIPPQSESILPLLTVLHLGLLTAVAAYLPLRVYAAGAALPGCYLKLPHESPFRVVGTALRLTRRMTPKILWMRLTSLPLLILPVTAIFALPALLTAEQLLTERAWRHTVPRKRSHFSRLELHARDTALHGSL